MREQQLDQEIKNLQDSFGTQEDKLKAAQNAAKIIMEQNRSHAMSDDDIRGRLAAMAADWKDWAKGYSHRKVQTILSLLDGELSEFTEAINRFATSGESQVLETLFHGARIRGTPDLLLKQCLLSSSCLSYSVPRTQFLCWWQTK